MIILLDPSLWFPSMVSYYYREHVIRMSRNSNEQFPLWKALLYEFCGGGVIFFFLRIYLNKTYSQ